MSLSILLAPPAEASTLPPPRSSSSLSPAPAAALATTSAAERRTARAAADLEATTRALIAAVNTRDCAAFKALGRRHFAPGFRGGVSKCYGGLGGFDALLTRLTALLALWPGHNLRIVHIAVHVGGAGGAGAGGAGGNVQPRRAQVYMYSELRGMPAEVVRRNVSCFRWALLGGRWRCKRWEVIRGPGGPYVGELMG